MEKRSIPGDLVEEILSRVPANYVARFRSTSKQWNALLRSGRFAKKHSANAPKGESLSIMLTGSRVCLVKINLHGFHNNVAPSAKVAYQFNLQDPLSNSSQLDIRHVFHCDGLLLCTTKKNGLMVWNPCSGETKWIKPIRDSYDEYDVCALGYDDINSSCERYKILRLRVDHRAQVWNQYDIYDFTSDSWTVFGSTDCYLPSGHCGVSVKGNSYWIDLYGDFLLSFDFSTEKFHSLSLPHPFPYTKWALSVAREDQLCLLGTDEDAYSRDLDVWVTTSLGSVMSWSKFLSVNANPIMEDIYRGLSFLADEQNKAVMFCNPYSKHNKILHVAGGDKHIQVDPYDRNSTIRPSSCRLLLNYVPSLAQIQQGTLLGGRKRKTQST